MIIQTEHDWRDGARRLSAYNFRLQRTRECDSEIFHLRARAGRALQHCLSRGGTPPLPRDAAPDGPLRPALHLFPTEPQND